MLKGGQVSLPLTAPAPSANGCREAGGRDIPTSHVGHGRLSGAPYFYRSSPGSQAQGLTTLTFSVCTLQCSFPSVSLPDSADSVGWACLSSDPGLRVGLRESPHRAPPPCPGTALGAAGAALIPFPPWVSPPLQAYIYVHDSLIPLFPKLSHGTATVGQSQAPRGAQRPAQDMG